MQSANPSIIKDNPLKFYYNRALRRFLPISASHNGGSNYVSAYPASDPFHNSVLILGKDDKLDSTKQQFLSLLSLSFI
jgi:hypothetical protein